LLESRVVNRTATFVFYLGERYFGTFTALVPGLQAGQYEYTSSLVAQILKTLLPQLKPALFPVLAAASAPVTPVVPPLLPAEPAIVTVPAAAPTVPKKKIDKLEGSSSEADPPQPQKPVSNGFPDSLDPSVVMPLPAVPDAGRVQ
jgi:hypothetical protein